MRIGTSGRSVNVPSLLPMSAPDRMFPFWGQLNL